MCLVDICNQGGIDLKAGGHTTPINNNIIAGKMLNDVILLYRMWKEN